MSEKKSLPKFPDLLPEEEGMLRVSRAWGYWKRTQKWRSEVVVELEKRIDELRKARKKALAGGEQFIPCQLEGEEIAYEAVLACLK